MSCPSCKCEEWKLASLVHSEGVSFTNSTSTGVGIGTGGIGIGSAKSSGQSQSILSIRAAPPTQAMLIPATLGVICGFILMFITDLMFNGKPGLWVGVAGVFGFLVVTLGTMKKFNPDFEQKYFNWQKTRMCLRCGTFYLPTE